jgi:hypothetical protein
MGMSIAAEGLCHVTVLEDCYAHGEGTRLPRTDAARLTDKARILEEMVLFGLTPKETATQLSTPSRSCRPR